MNPFLYFIDPVLRAPTIGCMLMCLSASLVGVIVFLRKESLLGEALSHAAYPGVICGIVISSYLFSQDPEENMIALPILLGAFLSALLGLWTIQFMEKKLRVQSDSALCFVLSSFFGLGLTLASRIQFTHSSLYNQIQVYLYGQAATMTDEHIIVYTVLSGTIVLTTILLYKELQIITFDRAYAKSLGIQVRGIDAALFALIVLAVVIGIRSVGIVLMSAMLIAPAAAARQYTNKLHVMLKLAGSFGLLSGFFGNYFSVELNNAFALQFPTIRLALPTGPMIVLVATAICILSLLLAPERGWVWRLWRIKRFEYKCLCENILKTMWHTGLNQIVPLDQIAQYQRISSFYLKIIMMSLIFNGWVAQLGANSYRLTKDGEQWARQIVRLHRLWEVYLVEYLGVGAERVHRNAEEMEHILTPEIEQELIVLLNDPKKDPHHQPIPQRDSL